MPAPTAPELTRQTLRPGLHQVMQFFGQRGHAVLIQQAIFRGQHARTDLDNPRRGGGGDFLAKQVGHDFEFDFDKLKSGDKSERRSQFVTTATIRYSACGSSQSRLASKPPR